MTHDDLTTLLRDHVSHDEPPAPLAGTALDAGRRRLRRRRLTAAGGTLAALVAGAAVVVPLLPEDGDRAGSGIDPASQTALDSYDVRAMPELMDEHVRAVLERSVPDLGASTFAARDDQGVDLPEQHWDKASSLEVEYGDRDHSWTTSISHARGEAEGDPEAYCAEGLDDGHFLECTVERTADGDVVISKLMAVRPQQGRYWRVVPREQLDRIDVGRVWFDREVKVIKSETLLTYATERLKATDRDPATAAFATSYADLAEIGTDPELVMPVPPPGLNGCPAWSLDGEDMSCGTVDEPQSEQ
jgi:hypothetical protein